MRLNRLMSDDELISAAVRTYLHAGGRILPVKDVSEVRVDAKRRRYVVLANMSAVLEVYRLDPGGKLRPAKTYPPKF